MSLTVDERGRHLWAPDAPVGLDARRRCLAILQQVEHLWLTHTDHCRIPDHTWDVSGRHPCPAFAALDAEYRRARADWHNPPAPARSPS
jgi:hypothetical protein